MHDGLGGLFLDALIEAARSAIPMVREAGRRVREITEPPAGVTLNTPDGTLYSGVFIVENNKPLVMFAKRSDPAARRPERHREGASETSAPAS